MKKSFISFWRRNLALGSLAIQNQLEYRLNLAVDLFIQPLLTICVEVALWTVVFKSLPGETLGGFTKDMYLAYAVWATFMGRVSSNWMFEFKMLTEIETGTVNSVLVRPVSFYEYYLSQFLGYKWMTLIFTIWVPFAVCFVFKLPVEISKVPIAMLLVAYYMVFLHTLSFAFASMAFFYNRVGSMTVGKNFLLWILMGELFPLDLVPDPYRAILIKLPSACGVYLPVGFVTGRVSLNDFLFGFVSTTIGILAIGAIAMLVWNKGRRTYSGTGA